MDVGPSAAPMMPMETASRKVKPIDGKSSEMAMTAMIVRKIPNCAAAPKNAIRGFWNNGRKSVMAPMPIKIRHGNSSVMIPEL